MYINRIQTRAACPLYKVLAVVSTINQYALVVDKMHHLFHYEAPQMPLKRTVQYFPHSPAKDLLCWDIACVVRPHGPLTP